MNKIAIGIGLKRGEKPVQPRAFNLSLNDVPIKHEGRSGIKLDVQMEGSHRDLVVGLMAAMAENKDMRKVILEATAQAWGEGILEDVGDELKEEGCGHCEACLANKAEKEREDLREEIQDKESAVKEILGNMPKEMKDELKKAMMDIFGEEE